jgi:hypothetical protein
VTAWIAPAAALLAFGAGAIALNRLPPGRGLAVALLAGAAGLVLLRNFAAAIPLAILGLVLATRTSSSGAAPSPGQRSEIRTDALAMWLDHDSGGMDGEVLSGKFAGRQVSGLTDAEAQALVVELTQAADEDSLSLFLGYLERERGSGPEAESGADEPRANTEAMSRSDAYRLLGLEEGASVEDVRAAHRRLIRRVHPDLGGSSELASMINAAKELLDPS